MNVDEIEPSSAIYFRRQTRHKKPTTAKRTQNTAITTTYKNTT